MSTKTVKITLERVREYGGGWLASSPDRSGEFYLWADDSGEGGFTTPLGEQNRHYPSLESAVADLTENWDQRCQDTHFRWTHWD